MICRALVLLLLSVPLQVSALNAETSFARGVFTENVTTLSNAG
jgi:hypothetical protein